MKREYIEKVRKIEISFMSFCLLALLTVLVSCEDWLDVRPKSQVKEEIFFESEDGFRDATLGIYTIMSSTSLYGGEATMAFLDVNRRCNITMLMMAAKLVSTECGLQLTTVWPIATIF